MKRARDPGEHPGVFRREATKVILVLVALVAGVYTFDRVRGAIDAPGVRRAPAGPDGGAAQPAAPPDLAKAPGPPGPSGALAPPPNLAKALSLGAPSDGKTIPPEVLKALRASGGKGLPPEIAKALGVGGEAGPGGAPAPAPAPPVGDALSAWPKDVPPPPAATLQTQIALDTRITLIYQTKAAAADTVAHYGKVMQELGWKAAPPRAGAEGTELAYSKGDRQAGIMVRAARDGQSTIIMTIPAPRAEPGGPG
ncbi:MAG TPA: hypothetical protein VGQ83_32040 [Polyangia bacterium]|jgi:hypothetical protein